MNVWLCCEADVTLRFEEHDDVRAAELKVRQLLPLTQRDPHLGGEDDRRDLAHANGEHRHQADGGVEHDEASRLGELVPRIVGGVHGAVRFQTVPSARVARDGFHDDLEIDLSRDHARLQHGPANGSVLPVVVGRVEERVHENPVDEPVLVRAALEQLANRPVQVLDRDVRIGPDFPLTGKGRIGGRHDDMWVAHRRHGAQARLEVSGEELVEGPPATMGDQVIAHVVTG